MAREIRSRNIAPILAAAEQWINTSLVADDSIFSKEPLWTPALLDEVYHGFVEHPDFGPDDFMTKLKRQINTASHAAKQLTAEMLWALLLFPSNMKPRTKRLQIHEVWGLSGQQLADTHPLLDESVLVGIGSGGPGFNNYRPDEMTFLIALVRDLKQKDKLERKRVLTNYEAFMGWIDAVPRQGSRQFRHMLRYFAFPDRVERMSSNNDRRRILEAFAAASSRELAQFSDRQLDDALMELRAKLQKDRPSELLDFYEAPLRQLWSRDKKVKTIQGEVPVTVPSDHEDEEEQLNEQSSATAKPDARQSIRIQAKLADIGAIMGFRIWVPRADRNRIRELVPQKEQAAFLEDLPLNYDTTTLDTIEQIDVLWLRGQAMVRAFEVEHTTAVYSGLLRMADLIALQPNMDIRLCIVAPDERREKVFREMSRPVFALLERGPLSRSCTFISYESVEAIRSLEHLSRMRASIIEEYEERAEIPEASVSGF